VGSTAGRSLRSRRYERASARVVAPIDGTAKPCLSPSFGGEIHMACVLRHWVLVVRPPVNSVYTIR
jgi:hypothetical protein